MNSIISYKLLTRNVLQTFKCHLHTTSTPQATIRNTVKPLDSRKTFLIDYYKSIFQNNQIVLFVHRNNLIKLENDKYRQEITKIGGSLTVIKNTLMKVYLKFENHKDPASRSAKRYYLKNKDKISQNPLLPLLKGPTGIITIKECDPTKVLKILKFLKSTNEKLFLIGGKIENKVFNISDIDDFKNLKTKEEMHLELVGVLTLLSGAGLVKTLESLSNSLYLTLKSHENELKPKDD